MIVSLAGIPNKKLRSHLKKSLAKAPKILVAQTKKEIETQDLSGIDKLMKHADILRGKVDLFTVGYENDERELVNIPEFLLWCEKVQKKYPNFPHLFTSDCGCHMAYLGALCGTVIKSDKPGIVHYYFDDDLVEYYMFQALCKDFGLSVSSPVRGFRPVSSPVQGFRPCAGFS